MRLTVLNVSYPLAPVSRGTAGGAEQVLAMLDAALVQNGHRSLVIAPEGSRSQGLLLEGSPMPHVLDENAKRNAQRRYREVIALAFRTFSVDVVHLHGLDFLEYLPEAGVPVVVTLHLPPGFYDPQIWSISRPETYLVCVSRSQKRRCPAGADIAAVIENGVPLNSFHPARADRKGQYVLYMGRICPEKGVHLAMDAAQATGVPCWIAGTTFAYSSHQQYFQEFIFPRLKKGKHRFLGAVGGRRKQHLLAGAKCLLVPSSAPETSSLVAMEAFACGTPVIAFRAGALCEIVKHGDTGFLVGCIEEMVDAIRSLDSLSSSRCRADAEARFSADRMVNEYFQLYERVAHRTALLGMSAQHFGAPCLALAHA